MAMPGKFNMTLVRDVTAILVLLGILWKVISFFNVKAADDAVLREQMRVNIENSNSFMQKFKEVDLKFEYNAKDHGTYDEHIRAD